LQAHLEAPVGRGHLPAGAWTGAAGGAACGDLVRLSLVVAGEGVVDAGFDASGCGAALAAGSAAVQLARERPLLDVARVGPDEVAAELGGLIPAKRHAAELAADALHRALGAATRAGARLEPRAGRTLVAMSGGVDSAVAALLAAREGDVVAVTLELWADREHDPESSCCSASAVRGARAQAHRMGVPHLTLDLREEFRAGVVQPFIDDHAAGLTPNPCIRCNGHVRLDAMLDLAGQLGAEALATGHYARVVDDGAGPLLRAAADPAKDQSYMLAALRPDALARLRFPLAELTKPEVRELAAEAGLPVATKRDSQDLCFLAGTDRASFLARHGRVRERPGDVVDRAGRVLGRHRGHTGYTVGQRKGLGVAAAEPLYVLATDADSNRVVVGAREDLRRDRVALRDATLHRDAARVNRVKLRYRTRPLACRVEDAPPGLEVVLDEAIHGAAPGQTAVLLDGDTIVGHATIA
jgi:tRNA-specific 2-thiouridylase